MLEPVNDLTLNPVERRRIGAVVRLKPLVSPLGYGVSGLS
jgi:hypothetical protein